MSSNYPPAYPQRGFSGRGVGINIVPILIGLVMAGLVFTRGCQKGPFDRNQVVGLTPQQEKSLGAQAYGEILGKERVLTSGPLVTAVQRVTRNLERATNDPQFLRHTSLKPNDFDWQVRVVVSDQVNAFCLPGGKMVVYTGIIPVAGTETGLAVVMGHEIAHALARHGAERVAHDQLARIGQMTAATSIDGLSTTQRTAVMAAIGLGTQFGVLLPFSRSHEAEADHIGLYLMATAGYDPAEAPRFWERMTARAGGRTPELLSTHPSSERRVRDLERWQSEVRATYLSAVKASDATRPLPTR